MFRMLTDGARRLPNIAGGGGGNHCERDEITQQDFAEWEETNNERA